MSGIFSLPIAQYHQPQSTRRSRYQNKKRKRKVKEANDSDTNASSKENQVQRAASQYSEYSAVISPDQRRQFRVAGQPFDEDLPPQPFPHIPAKVGKDRKDGDATPENGTSAVSRTGTLHQQHLVTITAVLHRSLARRDFARAGRALGLLLRDEVAGQAIDIRREGRWGIGAEVLLRQGVHKRVPEPDASMDFNVNDEAQELHLPGTFTRDGFETAKRYYERLIIQHPYDRSHPASIGAIDFYPAMFGLWIYVVQEEDRSVSKQQTVDQVREIAIRMDSCMGAAPYSDFAELLRLRGMVATWQADLIEDLILDKNSAMVEGSVARLSEPQIGTPRNISYLREEKDRARNKAQEMSRKLHDDQTNAT